MRTLLWAGMLSVVVSLGGCGGGDPYEAAQKVVTGAAGALRKEKTATVHFDVKAAVVGGFDSVHWTGTSRTRFGDPDATTTEFSRASVEMPNTAYGAGQPWSQTREVDLREVSVGGVRYQRSSKLRTPDGKPWVKLTDSRQYVSYGTQIANPDLGVLDPQPFLKVLEEVPEAVAMSGHTETEKEIGGVKTRLYQIECGLGSTKCLNSPLPAAFTQMFNGVNSPIVMKLWADDDGLPRELDVSADLDTGRSRSDTSATIFYKLAATMTFTDFGKPVEVTEPPDAETTTAYTVAL